MRFKEKVKQKFVVRCGKCGYVSGNGITGSLSSWFFHEQLCTCKENGSTEGILIGTADSSVDTIGQTLFEEKIDLGEQYEVLGVLGRGGMGTVYKAIDKADGSTVAIKVLREDLIADKNIAKRFEQEALSVSRLSHPNLIAVKTSGQSPSGAPFIVMDYFEGKSLADLIKEREHLSVAETVQITQQIAEAIDHAHAFSVIHRDIKPSNILLSQEGDQFIVKVVDFGIAKAMPDQQTESAQLTQTGEIFGSPAYMSPEQCLGETIDERSDIYSLGCVMYEMLTGKSPFASDNPIQTVLKHVNDEPERFEIEFNHLRIPNPVEEIVLKCLHKDPAKRFGTISALEQALKQLNGAPAPVPRRITAAVLDTVPPAVALLILLAQPWCIHLPRSAYDWMLPIFFIIYFATLERLRQGTPVKRVFGLRVMDMNGQRIGWLKSAIRVLILYSAIFLTWNIAWIIELTRMLLGLTHFSHHWTNVPLIIIGLLFSGYWLLIAFSKNQISPLDRLFGRVVSFPNLMHSTKGYSTPNKLQLGMALMAIASIVITTWTCHKLERIAVERDIATEGPLIYAIKDIPEGMEISADDIEVRTNLEFNAVPEDAITSIDDAKGSIAKYGITAGQIVFAHNLAPKSGLSKPQSKH